MPRTKIAEREDPLMETILGRKQKLKMTHAQLDKKSEVRRRNIQTSERKTYR